jgi:hypothetical protein
MKKTFLLILLLSLMGLFLSGVALGAPFLVCDPVPNDSSAPTEYVIQEVVTADGGQTWQDIGAPDISLGATDPNGDIWLYYDMATSTIFDVPNGSWTYKVKARNNHGDSTWTAIYVVTSVGGVFTTNPWTPPGGTPTAPTGLAVQ